MTFTSYAQNFEDVMLWRALSHVTPGFYIDIGAQDPVIDSVSLAFYQHGWRGIHVEPTRRYAEKISNARPDETVKRVAIGDVPGKLTFHEFPETGLSTADADIALGHVTAGHPMEKTEVQVMTLAVLLEEFRNIDIHWLKIDVEGMEASVLRGWQGSDVRPWILVLESTRPSSQEQNHQEWEPMVLANGYTFAYFDGLNRFYVHADHSELISAFRSPPNVFDGFYLSGTSSHPFYKLVQRNGDDALHLAQASEAAAVEQATLATNRASSAEATAAQQMAQIKALDHQVSQLDFHLQAVYRSLSWRVTKPLRWFKATLRSPRKQLAAAPMQLAGHTKRVVKSLGGKVIRKLLSYPALRAFAVRHAARFPAVDTRLRAMATRATKQQPPPSPAQFTDLAQMPESARRVFQELKRAIDGTGH